MPDETRSLPYDPALTDSVTGATASTGGQEPSHASVPLPTVERYVFGEEIARGGMGVIHRATDTVLNREVAVKVLQEQFPADSPLSRRFVVEAHITSQLQHPGIPPVHDLGSLPDGRPFLAMKLIRGRSLADLLHKRPDPSHDRGRFITIFEQVCQAVGFAHTHGVIHRDLKPANVMVGDFGEVQVMDWGLAKQLASRAASAAGSSSDNGSNDDAESNGDTRSLTRHGSPADDPDRTTDHRPAEKSTDERTRTGQVLGTPAFMPPEQARGETDRIDQRSDVFGLGAILCVVLTNRAPFAAKGAEARRLAANGDLTEAFARLDKSGADAELVSLCKRCLSPDPDDRPANAGEVAALVSDYRAGVDARLRTAERQRAAAEAKVGEQRKRWLVRVYAILILFGATGLATGFAYWWVGEVPWVGREIETLKKENQRLQEENRQVRGLHSDVLNRGAYRWDWDIRHELLWQEICYERVREVFFPDGPSPGSSEDYTRMLIEAARQDVGSAENVTAVSLGSLPKASRLRFAAKLHTSLGEFDRSAQLFALAKVHHIQMIADNQNELVIDLERVHQSGEVCLELAEALAASGRPNESAEEYRAAINWYDRFISPENLQNAEEVRRIVGKQTYAGRARALMALGRYAEAMCDWDQIPNSQLAVYQYRRLRAICLCQIDPVRARSEVEGWVVQVHQEEQRLAPSLDPDLAPNAADDLTVFLTPKWKDRLLTTRNDRENSEILYDAACVLALAFERLPEFDRDRCALQALSILHELKARGYFERLGHLARVEREPTLSPIRGRPDWQEFRTGLCPIAPVPREARRSPPE